MSENTNDFAFIFKEEANLYENLSTFIIDIAQSAISEKGAFYWAISGGSTPLPLFDLLREEKDSLDWKKVFTFWADERCVAPDHVDSNFGMAHKKLLQYLPMHYYRMEGELEDKDEAAQDYEQILINNVPLSEQGIPVLDLVLLGMGDDGHTASLFPHTEVLEETKKWVASVYVQPLESWRLTLTYPLINHATHKIIAIKGINKKAVFEEIQTLEEIKYPIQGIENGIWFVV